MRLLVSRGGSGVCRLLSAWSSRWACSITQLSTFGTCSALDASNSKAFAKPQPCGWIDALCCESSENFSCAGAAIANDDGMHGGRTSSSTEQGFPECDMLHKCIQCASMQSLP